MTTGPERPHVLYRAYDNDQLLYVGITLSPTTRFSSHASGKPWWQAVTRIDLEHFANRESAIAAETQAIKSENPAFNIVHTTQTAGAEAMPGTDVNMYRENLAYQVESDLEVFIEDLLGSIAPAVSARSEGAAEALAIAIRMTTKLVEDLRALQDQLKKAS